MLDLALTPDQKQLVETVRDFCSREFAPRIAADDRAVRHDPEIFAKLACFGLTEPNAGSDVASMQATAKRSGGSYLLSGQKVWVSDADTADFMLIFAKTDPKAGARGVSAFMVDRAASGKALRTEPI